MTQTGGDNRLHLEIPGFEAQAVAGQGGMGVVYRAEQQSPRRIVALKVLHGAETDPASLEELRREAELAAGLEHPAIVPLYSYGEHGGTPYLVMRYMPGGTVADRVRAGPIGLDQAVEWILRISEALAFAHERGIVHRDVKPSNFLLDDTGNAYLTDFGIAGVLEVERDPMATGSAPYMAPEQARGQAADFRADLYALAVSLFELLTGEPPYSAETAMGVRARHMHDPIPSARTRNEAIPAAVDELIRWTMAKEPAQRPQSASEFGRLLRKAVRSPSEPLRPPGTEHAIPEVTEPRVRRRSPLVWAVAAGIIILGGFVMLAGAGAIGAWILRDGPQVTPTATIPNTATPRSGPSTPVGRLFSLDFDNPVTDVTPTPDPDGGVTVVDGQLEFTVLREGVEWFYPSRRVRRLDVLLTVDVVEVAGAGENEIGMLCRWVDPANFVALAVSSSGQASIWKASAGQVSRLAGWTSVPPVTAPGSLTAVCAGETLRLDWNGQEVLRAIDPQPVDGDVGLLVGLRAPGELRVRMDNWVAEIR